MAVPYTGPNEIKIPSDSAIVFILVGQTNKNKYILTCSSSRCQ